MAGRNKGKDLPDCCLKNGIRHGQERPDWSRCSGSGGSARSLQKGCSNQTGGGLTQRAERIVELLTKPNTTLLECVERSDLLKEMSVSEGQAVLADPRFRKAYEAGRMDNFLDGTLPRYFFDETALTQKKSSPGPTRPTRKGPSDLERALSAVGLTLEKR